MKQQPLNQDADDPIVAEVHEIRRQLLEMHGCRGRLPGVCRIKLCPNSSMKSAGLWPSGTT
jgi:hypothetical protein